MYINYVVIASNEARITFIEQNETSLIILDTKASTRTCLCCVGWHIKASPISSPLVDKDIQFSKYNFAIQN